MALPALNVRVPNPANALLQAEQIKSGRAQNQALQQQQTGRNALLTAFQGNDFQTPEGRQAITSQVAQTAPMMALQLQQQFGALSAQDQAKVAREAQQTARGLVGVRDQAGYSQARAALGPIGQALPEQYDPNFVTSTINQARSIDSLMQQSAGFSLGAGQTRFDAAGNPIASVPATPPAPSAFDQRVSELRTRGFTQSQAQDIAAGRVRVSEDPVTGERVLVNVATGTESPVTSGSAAASPAGPASPQPVTAPVLTADERGRLFNQNASIERVLGLSEGMEDSARAAAGPRGNLGALVNSLSGVFGRDAPLPANEIAAARQDIRLFNQIAKTAIVNNPRFPVAEQEIVQRMLPNPDAFFTNPTGEFNKMLQLQDFLRNLQSQNGQSLGLEAAPVAETPTIQTQEDFDALPSGSRYVNPDDGLTYRKP